MDYIRAEGQALLDAHTADRTLSWGRTRSRHVGLPMIKLRLPIAFRLLSFHIEVRRTVALGEGVVKP